MRKSGGLFFVVLLMVSCTSPRYMLTSREALSEYVSVYGSAPLGRVFMLPSEYEKHSLPFLDTEPSRSVLPLLQDGQLKKAHVVLSDVHYDDTASFHFSSALVSYFMGDYFTSDEFLSKLDGYSQNCFMQLISADCDYENNEFSGPSAYESFLEKYQEVLDCASGDQLHKELVKSRIKLIRYGY